MCWEGNPERSWNVFVKIPGKEFQANPVPKNSGILRLKILDPFEAWLS